MVVLGTEFTDWLAEGYTPWSYIQANHFKQNTPVHYVPTTALKLQLLCPFSGFIMQ